MLVLAPQQLHGSEYGISLRRGRRLSMEDRADAINAYGKNISLFAIYDGHGGADVAELLQAELLKRVASHLDEETGTQQEALVSSFLTLEKMADEMEQADQCGSTAVVALLDEPTRQLHLSIAGNSIALLCSMEGPLLLTMPHELSLNEYELQRVRLAGGTVTDHSGGLKKRLAGDLELSRSFGDMRYRHLGLISTPEINRFDLREFQESSSLFLFLLLLSDGVVETLTYDEVCAHAKAQHLGLKRPAPSPPQPPPIVLPSGKISVWSRLMTWITHHLAGLSLPSQTGSLPHCCDCSPRSKCKELPRNRSAQSIAERVSVEAFNRGSSDNLAVIAINLAPPEPHDSLVLPGSLSYTLTTRLASLPSVLDPSVLHGHQSLFSVPYFQFGFWEHLLDDPSPLAMPDAIAMSEVIPCLGMNVGEGAIALRESMDVACSLFNELAVASSIALSLSERRSRVLLSFDGGDVSEKDEEGRERLGSGSFGSVWRAKSKGNHGSFVIKKLDHRRKEAIESGEREAYFGRLLSKAHVPSGGGDHVVRFVEHFWSEDKGQGKDLFLVFSDAGKSLHNLMYSESSQSHDHQWAIMGPSDWWRRQRRDSASSSTFVRTILWQLLTALDQIHSNGIVHRDIKPENVMVQREGLQSEDDAQLHIRVIDFGSSLDDYTLSNSLFSKSGISSAQTTVEYSPPEQLFGSRYWEKMATESHIHPYARASDIWAAGVIALELVLGTPNVFELTDVERKTFEKKMKAAGRDGRDLASHRLLLLLRGMLELCVHPSMRLDVDRKAMPKGNHVASVRCNDAYFGQKVKEKDPMHWGFTDDAIDLVRRMLHWDSGKRISAREALAHAFFNSNS